MKKDLSQWKTTTVKNKNMSMRLPEAQKSSANVTSATITDSVRIVINMNSSLLLWLTAQLILNANRFRYIYEFLWIYNIYLIYRLFSGKMLWTGWTCTHCCCIYSTWWYSHYNHHSGRIVSEKYKTMMSYMSKAMIQTCYSHHIMLKYYNEPIN